MDGIIEAIENLTREEIPCIVNAAIQKYREEYPDWQLLFVSVETNATDLTSMELKTLICKANEMFVK